MLLIQILRLYITLKESAKYNSEHEMDWRYDNASRPWLGIAIRGRRPAASYRGIVTRARPVPLPTINTCKLATRLMYTIPYYSYQRYNSWTTPNGIMVVPEFMCACVQSWINERTPTFWFVSWCDWATNGCSMYYFA